MRKIIYAGTSVLAIFSAYTVHASDHKHHGGRAPIGVIGGHLHDQGEWMLAYKYKQFRTSGVRNGNDSVLVIYGEVPTEMDMGMHMFEIMYGVTGNFTLMVMPQYMQMEMTHLSHGHHGAHTHEVEGPGDTEITGLYSVYHMEGENISHNAHLNIGVSLPTSSIDEKFTNHHGETYNLPYNMQLGSGTFDPIIGATYSGNSQNWSWGGQMLNYIRVGKNDEGYRQGNKYTATTWVAHNLADYANLSFRVEGEAWENVSGRGINLPLTTIAGANPDEQAGERMLAYVGLNLTPGEQHGVLSGPRLSAEFGLPFYERYSGPLPETDWRLILSWQWSF